MKATKKDIPIDRLVVVGTSAGGLGALVSFVEHMPADFPVPILVVMHLSPDASGQVLLDALNALGRLPCSFAISGAKVKGGNLYLAPSDHHLLIEKSGLLLTTRGAQENRYRPGIDPLFRSAAVSFGNRVIGIVLSGYLDDGTAGLMAIKRCGGICIVQDPSDAQYPDMPINALAQVRADYQLPVSLIGPALVKMLLEKPPKAVKIPADIITESRIAQRVLSDLPSVEALGDQVPFNCPGCGGVLWQIGKGPSCDSDVIQDIPIRQRC